MDDQNPYLSRARISTKTARYADLEIRPNFQWEDVRGDFTENDTICEFFIAGFSHGSHMVLTYPEVRDPRRNVRIWSKSMNFT